MSVSLPIDDLRRIAKARRTLSVIRLRHKRELKADDDLLKNMFDRSLEIEPDGRGLAWVLQAAYELACVPFSMRNNDNGYA